LEHENELIIDGENAVHAISYRGQSQRERRRRVCVLKTTDGGKNWNFVSWIADLNQLDFPIMPASGRLSDQREIFRTTSQRENQEQYIDAYFPR